MKTKTKKEEGKREQNFNPQKEIYYNDYERNLLYYEILKKKTPKMAIGKKKCSLFRVFSGTWNFKMKMERMGKEQQDTQRRIEEKMPHCETQNGGGAEMITLSYFFHFLSFFLSTHREQTQDRREEKILEKRKKKEKTKMMAALARRLLVFLGSTAFVSSSSSSPPAAPLLPVDAGARLPPPPPPPYVSAVT